MGIEQSVQCLGTLGQFSKVAFLQGLSECVEQAPHVAFFKGIMPWLAPFMQHGWDETVAAHADIRGADDQVMSFDVGDFGFFVSCNAFVLIMPFGEQESDGAADQLRQIAHDEPRVFAREFDLATEAQIVTNEDAGPGDDAGGERLVVTVTKTKHPAIVVTGFLGVDFHQTEVALTLMG